MSEEFVQLKWNTYQSAFLENLSSLRDKQVFTDVTLSCGDQFYPAHRLILSSCSTFFARALGVVSCRSPVLLLHGIEQSTLEQLLMFMYDGQVTIARKNLPDLLKAAQWLGVKGLESTCDSLFNQTCESPDQPDNAGEQINLLQCLQNWKQLLSPLSSNRECLGNLNIISALQKIASRIDEQSNTSDDVVVSHVAPLSSSSECDDISTEVKPDAGEEDPNYEDNYLGIDNITYTGESVSLHDIPEHFLEVRCSSQQSGSSAYSFEGWEDVDRVDTNKSLRYMEKELNITEEDVVPEYLPHEEAENGSKKENNFGQVQTKGKRSLRCKHCKRSFTVRVELAKHLRTHHNSTKNFCHSCNKEFVNAKNFRMHMKLHDSNYLHSCSKCDFITHNKRSLNKHLLTHKDENSLPLQSDAQENALQIPQQELGTVRKESSLKTLKSKGMSMKCPTCWKIFRNYKILQKHRVLGCDREKKEFSCPECSYVGTRKRSLEDHMSKHTGVYRFHCSICNYQCRRNNNLQKHIKKTHLNVSSD